MIDHIGIAVSDYQKSKKFYETALKPINYELIREFENVGGFGENKKPDFWIAQGEATQELHVAFACDTREKVDAFYKAALEAGGKDNGPPGLREHYHPGYYGAFVIDPDGNNIEAVCHHSPDR
jgi:catechol 2,3-dioxygenase-like lactoylglutathione lyase family enzyme